MIVRCVYFCPGTADAAASLAHKYINNNYNIAKAICLPAVGVDGLGRRLSGLGPSDKQNMSRMIAVAIIVKNLTSVKRPASFFSSEYENMDMEYPR
jgi:hypothetical protein